MGTNSRPRTWGRAFSEDEEAVPDVGVNWDGSARTPAGSSVGDSGFDDFAVPGADVPGEFRCADCGYGAVVRRALPQCPMCGGTVWESRAPRS